MHKVGPRLLSSYAPWSVESVLGGLLTTLAEDEGLGADEALQASITLSGALLGFLDGAEHAAMGRA
jgi:hypothetical protein